MASLSMLYAEHDNEAEASPIPVNLCYFQTETVPRAAAFPGLPSCRHCRSQLTPPQRLGSRVVRTKELPSRPNAPTDSVVRTWRFGSAGRGLPRSKSQIGRWGCRDHFRNLGWYCFWGLAFLGPQAKLRIRGRGLR